ncbi:hypothetical protein PILCRDRAFT_818398 [Piloderma croceum F 1598]|uniref:Uncharacterized protein n=1 Tax=Piloderma croceum (strain F 1598) TaxID=765440 RepID=A0A0C3C3F3_PILCF|nr:hypothetical protein PILCRDRAFT_818398 [Piloderma croceum F 1598]
MANGPPTEPVLLERAEIHKSCKSLETLVNVLNDYCEAASAIVALQKKLAKALRETAGLKVTGEIAANALNASASIFEVKSDIDTKFGKIADKEYDAINVDVKKWFKKLAKEERAHDERVNTANIRIKQAGQTYEKKSKKNARDANDEHGRYINLISSLAPEISQLKLDHALLVTQKHISTTYYVAACLSRIADTEWVRSCEEVRRFSATIGQLGQWRALCEGAWTGSIPQDLPDLDEAHTQSSSGPGDEQLTPQITPIATMEIYDSRNSLSATEQNRATSTTRSRTTSSREPFISRKPSNIPSSAAKQARTSSFNDQSASLDAPKASFAGKDKWTDTMGSVASLSSFPSPPTHVPMPLTSTELDVQSPRSRQPQAASTPSGAAPLSESPKPWNIEEGMANVLALNEEPKSPRTRHDGLKVPTMTPITPNTQENSRLGLGISKSTDANTLTSGQSSSGSYPDKDPINSPTFWTQTARQSLHISDAAQGIEKSSSAGSTDTASSAAYKQQNDYLPDEFGLDRSERYGQLKSKSMNAVNTQGPETNTSGSIVAAMRNRYANTAESSLPSPKDVPRLPLSVNELASRYKPIDVPASPRQVMASPADEQQPRSLEVLSPRPTSYSTDRTPDGRYMRFPSPSTEANMEELARRRRQREELAEQEKQQERQQEMKQKERTFEDRQQEIEMRTRELERDRALTVNSRDSDTRSDAGYTVKTTRISDLQEPQRRYSQFDSPTPAIPQGRYSYSTTHLVPPLSSMELSHSRSQPSSPANESRSLTTADHADFCGCESCSVSKYRTRNIPSPHDLRPPEPPITLRPDKPKGWIRRLSMPMGNAFSLDSKKSNPSLKNGMTSLVGEDGRIRSFEQGGISNRNMSDVGRR